MLSYLFADDQTAVAAHNNNNGSRGTGLAPNEVHIDREISEVTNDYFGRARGKRPSRSGTGPIWNTWNS